MPRFPGFIGASYEQSSVNADSQRSVNLYLERNEMGTLANGERFILRSAPGHNRKFVCGNGPIRGMYFTSTGRLAVVSGNTLYRVDPDLSVHAVGAIDTVSGPVSMADNGTQLMIVDGPYGYILSLVTGQLTRIISDGFNGANKVVFIGGYFVCNNPGTGQWFRSNAYDGFTWDPLNYATAESDPDNLRTVAALNNELWLIGINTIEPWYLSGAATTFSRTQGATISYGCDSGETVRIYNNSLVWLGGGPNAKGVVWQAEGHLPKRISTHALENALQSYGNNLYKATAYTYQSGGHSFYCLNVPGADRTWVYDVATESWHERCYLGPNGLERDRGEVFAQAYGMNLVGDYVNGNVYELSDTTYSHYGNPLVRLRRAPHLSKNMKRMFHSQLQLDIEPGVGLDGGNTVAVTPFATGDGVTPTWTIPSDPGTSVFVEGIYLTDWRGTYKLSPNPRTNWLKKSNNFADSTWVKSGVTVAAGITAPDGVSSSSKITLDSTPFSRHSIAQIPVSTSGNQILSIYGYLGSLSKIELQIGGKPYFRAVYDLLHGTCETGTGATTGIEPVASAPGWYRCWINLVASANDTATISLVNNDGLSVYDGDGSSYLYLAFSQLEPSA